MEQLIKKYPLPVSGLMLGLAAAGNLVKPYGEGWHNAFGLMSGILFVLLVVKIVKHPNDVLEDLNNPVAASVFPTFSMSIVILSTYIKQYSGAAAFVIWCAGVAMHVVLILWFTRKFLLKLNIKQVFPSWFIVYVGSAAASVTAPVFRMENAGQAAFWFGFGAYIMLLPVILYRVAVVRQMPEQTLPTLAIFSAPASLLLTGYMNSFGTKNFSIVLFLLALSVIMYIAVMAMMPKLLRLRFCPSYSGFTFPLVISATAVKLACGYLSEYGITFASLNYLSKFQEAAAVAAVIYVLLKYVLFLLPEKNAVSEIGSDAA